MAPMMLRILGIDSLNALPRPNRRRRLEPTRAALSIAEFHETILRSYGSEAAAARHEAYFIYARGGKVIQALYGVAALLRDIVLLYNGPRAAAAGPPSALAIVTLAGQSGYGTLKSAMVALRTAGHPVILAVHPRAAGVPEPSARLPRPERGAFRAAVAAAARAFLCRHSVVSSMMVASVVARRELWLHTWRAMAPSVAHALILHNDFDMMSATAVDALRGHLPSICVQHGVPTDEFFPTRADWHVVWGSASREIYVHRGISPERIIIDPLTRGARRTEFRSPPQRILLVSQTHTTIYRLDLAALLEKFAASMAASAVGDQFAVLLHPEEVRLGHPYRGKVERLLCQGSAHLDNFVSSQLVIGFSSTAMIEAALAGHYVAALDWQPKASKDAHRLAAPPMTVADDAAAVTALFERLRDSEAARLAHGRRQGEWLAATFAPSDQIEQGLARLIASFAPAMNGDRDA
jgi:hypothetical protein